MTSWTIVLIESVLWRVIDLYPVAAFKSLGINSLSSPGGCLELILGMSEPMMSPKFKDEHCILFLLQTSALNHGF